MDLSKCFKKTRSSEVDTISIRLDGTDYKITVKHTPKQQMFDIIGKLLAKVDYLYNQLRQYKLKTDDFEIERAAWNKRVNYLQDELNVYKEQAHQYLISLRTAERFIEANKTRYEKAEMIYLQEIEKLTREIVSLEISED